MTIYIYICIYIYIYSYLYVYIYSKRLHKQMQTNPPAGGEQLPKQHANHVSCGFLKLGRVCDPQQY